MRFSSSPTILNNPSKVLFVTYWSTSRELFAKMELPKDYAVAFCPMYKGGSKWVQKKGTLANPYFGKTMLTCGTFEKS